MRKILTEEQESLLRKEADDLIEAMSQASEKNELAHASGLAQGYIKALFACGLYNEDGLNALLTRATKNHNWIAKNKGW